MPLVKFVGESEGQKRPKKQKLVKHRRKNWAKTDISDVERSIDDLRRQKLAGYLSSHYNRSKVLKSSTLYCSKKRHIVGEERRRAIRHKQEADDI